MSKDKLSSITKDSSPAVKIAAEIGTEMQVEIATLNSRVKLILIGVLASKYLIYHLPQKVIQASNTSTLKANTTINVRCISRGTAFGFQSTIISATVTPDTLLFVNYPKNIQQHTIRKSQRVKCLLPAKLLQESVTLSGIAADISRSGCHFQSKKDFLSQKQAALIQSTNKITFALSLPGMEGDKQLSALIKNTFIDTEKVQIGIQFIDVDENTIQLIDDFVEMSFDLPPF